MRSLRQSLPSLNALAVFEAAARRRSFTRAAAELNIAQSAVSRHVANLEADLGVALFVRSGNRLELTSSGATLADAILTGLGCIRTSVEAIRRRQDQTKSVTIACSYAMAHDWLMPRFGMLRELLPTTQLRLITSDIYPDFDSEEVDLSIRYGNVADWPDMKAKKILEEVAFPVCAPSLLERLPELRSSSSQVWQQAPLLHLGSMGQGRIDWPDWFDGVGLMPELNGPIFSAYTPMLQEALAGRGVVLGWQGIVDPYISSGQLVRLSERSITSNQAFYVVYRPDARETLFEAVADILMKPNNPGDREKISPVREGPS